METLPKYKIGQVVVMKSLKKQLPFKILNRIFSDGEWYYYWNRNNAASEHMIRELNAEEKGEE